ncbi:MAG: serine protein kinase [Planctomycetes bacterium]|nr:serine protein kinase [Planctomycetota bacterium]
MKGEAQNEGILERIFGLKDQRQKFLDLYWEGTFEDYLKIFEENPKIARNAFQRVYDMIMLYGIEKIDEGDDSIIKYKFFSDPFEDGKNAVFGLEKPLMTLVNALKSASHSYGTEKRIILLHGPVGSAKSTVAKLLKTGLELYSRSKEGVLYSFSWQDEKDPNVWHSCPMHEEPLKILPIESRKDYTKQITSKHQLEYRIEVEGNLCPFCRYYFNTYISKYNGDLTKMLRDKVKVRRILLSEKDRIGIGTFQPKDEKNQDSTELTGDINYRKIAEFGSDSDPRAFNFDGEFNIANRGVIEFIEILKLDVAFLYDLLTASQEHVIKPKKFSHTEIDEVIIGHTNEPEYRKLQSNDYMEAFRDRTLKIDIPYNLRLDNELKIYERDFNPKKIKSKHVAPHLIEIASMWAVLTRLEGPKKANITLLQKLKLYNGKSLPGITEEVVKELKKEAQREGMEGISPRYIQDKLSNALVKIEENGCINVFMLLNELESGLDHHSLVTSDEQKRSFKELLAEVKVEYENIVKNEVQRAICADEEAITRLFTNYVEHVKAYTTNRKIKNKLTGEDEEPDERLMRSIEEKMDIPDSRKDDFRRELMNYIGALAVEGKKFDYKSNERLQRALELKLFEDQKDTIKLSSLISGVVDDETQEKIDIVKTRLIKQYKYCDICATEILSFVASVFARGEAKK